MRSNLPQRVLTTSLKIAFAVALIYWLARKGVFNLEALKIIATPAMVAFVVACVFAQIFANNYRWLTLMRAQGFESDIATTMPLSLIGMFFNFAMPGGVGGDVIKAYYLVQQMPQKKIAAVLSIFMDRMVGFFVMIATAFFALFLNWNEVAQSRELTSIAYAVTALFIGFLFFFGLSFSIAPTRSRAMQWLFAKAPGGQKIKALYEVLHSYRQRSTALVIAIAMSLINQMLIVAVFAGIGAALGLGDEIPLSMYFFLVPIGTVILALPISPAGIGVGQAAFFFLFKLHLHHESPIGPVASSAIQLASFFWGLFGAYYYLRQSHRAPVS